MGTTQQEESWFWKVVNRANSLLALLSALGLTLIGLVSGLLDIVLKFSPILRAITIAGTLGILVVLLAASITAVKRRVLLRRIQHLEGQEKVQAATMFKMSAGARDTLLLGNLAEGVDTFLDSSGPLQGLQAAGNTQRIDRRSTQVIRVPVRLDRPAMQELARQCQDTSQAIHQFLLQREDDFLRHVLSRTAGETSEGQSDETARRFMETVGLYRKQFGAKVLALAELAADNGMADEALMREARYVVNPIMIATVADRLGAIAEKVRFSTPP
jgi:hypothetical protein